MDTDNTRSQEQASRVEQAKPQKQALQAEQDKLAKPQEPLSKRGKPLKQQLNLFVLKSTSRLIEYYAEECGLTKAALINAVFASPNIDGIIEQIREQQQQKFESPSEFNKFAIAQKERSQAKANNITSVNQGLKSNQFLFLGKTSDQFSSSIKKELREYIQRHLLTCFRGQLSEEEQQGLSLLDACIPLSLHDDACKFFQLWQQDKLASLMGNTSNGIESKVVQNQIQILQSLTFDSLNLCFKDYYFPFNNLKETLYPQLNDLTKLLNHENQSELYTLATKLTQQLEQAKDLALKNLVIKSDFLDSLTLLAKLAVSTDSSKFLVFLIEPASQLARHGYDVFLDLLTKPKFIWSVIANDLSLNKTGYSDFVQKLIEAINQQDAFCCLKTNIFTDTELLQNLTKLAQNLTQEGNAKFQKWLTTLAKQLDNSKLLNMLSQLPQNSTCKSAKSRATASRTSQSKSKKQEQDQ